MRLFSWMSGLALLGVFAAGTVLAGCGQDEQCSEELPCGFGEICVEGSCVTKSCATSQQCSMEEYCAKGSCTVGCEADTDCYPGDVCDPESTSCVAGACRSSSLDCDYKQFCDPAAGDCYDASGYYCSDCSSDDDCGGNGNLCLNFGLSREFCGVTCGSEDDCPSGFTCVPVSVEQGVSYQCITYCWLYEDDDQRWVDPARVRAGARPVPVDPQSQPHDPSDELPTCATEAP